MLANLFISILTVFLFFFSQAYMYIFLEVLKHMRTNTIMLKTKKYRKSPPNVS